MTEAAPLAARRRFQRPVAGGPDRVTFGPWHVRKPDTWTLCGQRLSATIDGGALDARAITGGPPLDGRVCVRCWDRHEGRRRPGQFHPGIADPTHTPRPTPSDPRTP
jgi:hypothetical protein